MTNTIMITASGRNFDILTPFIETISIRDIAHHLAGINRFCGASERPISVAQHSIVVSKAVESHGPRLAMLGLLHDAHEFVTSDIPTPMKNAIAKVAGHRVVEEIQANIDRHFWLAFNLASPNSEELAAIRQADESALASEWIKAMPTEPPQLVPPVRIAWSFLSADRARDAFLIRFRTLACALPGMRGLE